MEAVFSSETLVNFYQNMRSHIWGDNILESIPYLKLKIIISWDMTPCSQLSVNRRFGGIYCLHLQGRRNKFSNKWTSKQQASHLLTCWFLDKLISSTLKMEAICSSERLLTLNGLHGVISQKMILFITTAVKTSDPAYLKFLHKSIHFQTDTENIVV
jgi:hypothetical protein